MSAELANTLFLDVHEIAMAECFSGFTPEQLPQLISPLCNMFETDVWHTG
jgi:hypothetical protein